MQNFVPVLDGKIRDKCSKTFCKIFGRQNTQEQTNKNIPVTLRTFWFADFFLFFPQFPNSMGHNQKRNFSKHVLKVKEIGN